MEKVTVALPSGFEEGAAHARLAAAAVVPVEEAGVLQPLPLHGQQQRVFLRATRTGHPRLQLRHAPAQLPHLSLLLHLLPLPHPPHPLPLTLQPLFRLHAAAAAASAACAAAQPLALPAAAPAPRAAAAAAASASSPRSRGAHVCPLVCVPFLQRPPLSPPPPPAATPAPSPRCCPRHLHHLPPPSATWPPAEPHPAQLPSRPPLKAAPVLGCPPLPRWMALRLPQPLQLPACAPWQLHCRLHAHLSSRRARAPQTPRAGGPCPPPQRTCTAPHCAPCGRPVDVHLGWYMFVHASEQQRFRPVHLQRGVQVTAYHHRW